MSAPPPAGPTRLAVLERRREEGGWRARLSVLPAAAYFEGHFPGRPVLPAIAQLAILADALEQVLDRPVVLTHIDRLRLFHPVAPDEELVLELSAQGEATMAFSLQRGGRRVSEGFVGWAEDGDA